MKKLDDKQLEKLLNNRMVAPESSDFADRIISASHNVLQKQKISIGAWVIQLFSDFMIPKPAYTFASILIIGLCLGFTAADMPDYNDDDQDVAAVQELLYDDEVSL